VLDTVNWFAVKTRPRAEAVALAGLKYKGYETFFPQHRSGHSTGYRERPLFPGYLFCRCAPEANGLIVTSPGVLGLVKLGKVAVPVEDEEIQTIRQLVESSRSVQPHPGLVAGCRVRVVTGPLAGVEGTYVSRGKGTYVVVSVVLLKRSVAVELGRDAVEPCV
jgi:transcription antitermination factor NusG